MNRGIAFISIIAIVFSASFSSWEGVVYTAILSSGIALGLFFLIGLVLKALFKTKILKSSNSMSIYTTGTGVLSGFVLYFAVINKFSNATSLEAILGVIPNITSGFGKILGVGALIFLIIEVALLTRRNTIVRQEV